MTKKYTIEADFEKDVVAKLNACGWTGGANYPFVLEYPTEEELIQNWANIIFEHNRKELNNVPDKTDETLKVLRSYQFNAVRAIRNKVSNHKDKWNDGIQTGGYVWNTTGSGKTLTSFKTAQIISEEGLCDKVIFLLDRIELGTQTLLEYKNFSDDTMDVQDTANTDKLWKKLLSDNNIPGVNTKLIVTSIQKMSNLVPNEKNKKDFVKINKKKIVIIIDEAHRDTFGTMLSVIKNSFPNALFFGFTGTPIFEENKKIIYSKDDSGSAEFTTADVFGDEFKDATYTIANGIHDGNVLGFDPCMKLLNNDNEVRKVPWHFCH